MVSRLALSALAACALAGAAFAADAQPSPLSTDISARSGGGFRGGGGFRAGGGFRGGGSLAGGGGVRLSSGGGMRSVSHGGFRLGGTHFRTTSGPVRIGAAQRFGSFAAPGLHHHGAWRVHRQHRHRIYRRAAFTGGLGGLWLGSSYYYPSTFVDGPSCTGVTAEGCVLRWADVPVGGGLYPQRCVAYCPY